MDTLPISSTRIYKTDIIRNNYSIDELTAEIGSVSERVTFNDISLLNVGDNCDHSVPSAASSAMQPIMPLTNGQASFTQLPPTDPYIGMAELVFSSNGITFSLIQKVSAAVDADSLEYYNLEFELVNKSGSNLGIDLMFVGDTDYWHTSGPSSWSSPDDSTPAITINNTPLNVYDSDTSGSIPGTILV